LLGILSGNLAEGCDSVAMPENQGSSSSLSSFGRSIFGVRQEQVHSVEAGHESDSCNLELGSFQKRVTDRFQDLSVASDEEFLSISWIQKVLNAFILCQEEFRAILLNNKEHVTKPPLDRMVSEFFDRSVKALDICNASRDGIEKIRTWQKHLEIVFCALGSPKRALTEGQFRRARKALMDLALAMLDEKESGSIFSLSEIGLLGDTTLPRIITQQGIQDHIRGVSPGPGLQASNYSPLLTTLFHPVLPRFLLQAGLRFRFIQ